MKVLHLPTNIASQVSVTVRALRDIGVDARGLVVFNAPIQDATGLESHSFLSRRRYPLRGTWSHVRWWINVHCAIRWADVIHWHFAETQKNNWDLRLASRLNKPGIVEFWGSDVRIPEEEEKINPYYAAIRHVQEYARMESREGSYARQEKFVHNGIDACLHIKYDDMYLKPGLWRHIYHSRQRVLLGEFMPVYPPPENRRPLLVHSPTAKIFKGTAAVEAAVGKLRREYEFDFRLIHGMEFFEANRLKQECDVFLDQFCSGAYGLASVEAMAMGKPVVCFLRPYTVQCLPAACPIINANPDNLADVIAPYLQDGQLRYQTGLRSRKFAESYHDACVYAKELVKIYESLIDEKRQKK